MFSVRNTTILLSAIAGLAQGCGGSASSTAHKTGETVYNAAHISSKQADSPVRDSAEVTTPDAAMDKRQWTESVAYIPNGATVAGPTGFAYEPRRDQKSYQFYYADTGNFFLNLVTMPFTLYKTPPLSEQTFPGEQLKPTYTAVPPLPPEKVAEPVAPPPAEVPAPAEMPAPSAETPAPAPSAEPPAPEQPPATQP